MTTAQVVASCCECGREFGPIEGPACLFASIDEAMDFFIDGADGFELYGDRLFCEDCLKVATCYNPGHDWHIGMSSTEDLGAHHITRQCERCGLLISEVLA
ncbi:60S ribosomal export protein NMD3 [Nocardia asteroides]|uniref:60S ribosomal export protein NMD3 n=1 Tax=Nocardia asteroides TaxID=1824 RepID=UPI001E42657A|nr:60S ribosomal export protein NMD3 [Nocardia asteroides]UGT53773.1 60S ribosomal export protein NMD3 [Nocardia asteroides]